MIGICFSGGRHDGALSLGRKAAGGGPAGPIAGCQGSRLASSWVRGEYPAGRRRLSRGKTDAGGWRAGQTPATSGADGVISRALNGTDFLIMRRDPLG